MTAPIQPDPPLDRRQWFRRLVPHLARPAIALWVAAQLLDAPQSLWSHLLSWAGARWLAATLLGAVLVGYTVAWLFAWLIWLVRLVRPRFGTDPAA